MGKEIHLISFDETWNELECEIIDQLYEYDCLDKITKDTKTLIGQILLKHVLKEITTCTIDFENTPDGLLTYLSTDKYPFVIFYLDENKITHDKEILEYYDYNDFVALLKELVRDFNIVTNHRIIYCFFPFTTTKHLVMGEETKNSSELALKTEILIQYYQQKKLPAKKIKQVASRYGITLDGLKIRKIIG